MKHISISILALPILLVLSVGSFAGNPNNAAATGNVTAVVVCEIDDETLVDEISVVVVSDGCSFELVANPHLDSLNCEKGDNCMGCLGALKLAGMTITRANAYVEPDESDAEELAYHLLEGNAGPFLSRIGGCPAP